MTQIGLLATRSPSDNMKVVYLEAEEKGCKKKRKRTKQQSPAQSARHKCCACDGRHRGRDERHATQPCDGRHRRRDERHATHPCDGRHTWCDERHTIPLLCRRR
jgi:hypothetical protein